MVPVRGDVREDGFIFRGYEYRGDRKYEKWMSPSAVAHQMKFKASWQAKKRARRKSDPVLAQQDRDKSRIHMTAARKKYPERMMFNHAKCRAKRNGLAFDIELLDVVIPTHCPVLGIAIGKSDGVSQDSSAELDRIDNSKGYVKGNVIVVSRRANRIKNDSTVEELRKIYSFYSTLMASS